MPLSEPIRGVNGQPVAEVTVPKGTTIIVGIRACNLNPDVWGEDADEWNPDRFSRADIGKHTNVGVFANL